MDSSRESSVIDSATQCVCVMFFCRFLSIFRIVFWSFVVCVCVCVWFVGNKICLNLSVVFVYEDFNFIWKDFIPISFVFFSPDKINIWSIWWWFFLFGLFLILIVIIMNLFFLAQCSNICRNIYNKSDHK